MHYHHQNLTRGELPLWRHGRAWLGRLGLEWSVFRRPGLSVSFGKDDDRGLCFSLSLVLLSFHVTWRVRVRVSREFDLYYHEGAVWLALWQDPWSSSSKDPWWKKMHSFSLTDWILGRWRHESTDRALGEVLIPMPEGCYRAQATETKRIWRRRFRITKRRTDVSLNIEGGIPFAGKGENSWDCGDDGLWGCGGETVEKAVAHAVESVLVSRRKRGYDSKDTGRRPALVLNENHS